MAATVAELLVRIGADTREAEAGLSRVEQQTGGVLSFFKGAAQQALGFGTAVAGLNVASGIFDSLRQAVFGFNSQMQQAQIGFTTMLGSAERAGAFLQQLQQFARTTPFEFPDLVTASQRLLAMGFSAEQVIPTLTAVGDAVSALGGGSAVIDRVIVALGQMRAKGKVSAEEMMQLTEAGIPAWEMLAKAIGVDVPTAMKMAEKGAIDANTAITAITQGMEERFGGMMVQQSTTLAGALSNVKDSFMQLAAVAGRPIFDLAAKGAAQLAELLSSPALQQAAQQFAQGIAAGISAIGDLAGRLTGPLQAALSVVQSMVPQFRQAFASLFSGGDADGMFSGLSAALEHLKESVQSALNAIAGFWQSHKEQIASTLGGLAESAVQAFAGIAREVGPTLDAVVSIIERIVGEIRERWSLIEGILGPIIEGAVANVQAALDILSNAIQLTLNIIQGDWEEAWNNIKAVGEGVWDIITNSLKAWADAIPNILRLAWDVLDDLAEGAWNAVKAVVEAAWGGITAAIESAAGGILDFLSALPGRMVGALGDLGSLLVESGVEVIRGFISGIANTTADLLSTVSNLPGQIAGAIGDLGGLLVGAGRDLIQGLINGIVSMGRSLADAVARTVLNNIPGPVRSILGLGSPSKLFEQYGKWTIEGLMHGLAGGVPRLRALMTDLATAMAVPTVVPAGTSLSVSPGVGSASSLARLVMVQVIVQGPVYGLPAFEQAVAEAVNHGLRTGVIRLR